MGLCCIRHCRWNIPCLYSDDDRTENIAPYCHQYVQLCAPIVGTSVSILLGMGTFGIAKGIAVALVFTGVYIVTQSKSREQMLAEQATKKE